MFINNIHGIKVTLKGNQNIRATERKREKFAGNASAEIWERERKVEEMLLDWGQGDRKVSTVIIMRILNTKNQFDHSKIRMITKYL